MPLGPQVARSIASTPHGSHHARKVSQETTSPRRKSGQRAVESRLRCTTSATRDTRSSARAQAARARSESSLARQPRFGGSNATPSRRKYWATSASFQLAARNRYRAAATLWRHSRRATGVGELSGQRRPSRTSRSHARPLAFSVKVTKRYEIYSGKRVVSTEYSVSPLQAAVAYARSFDSADAEIMRVGVDCVSWRGRRFTAVLAPEPVA